MQCSKHPKYKGTKLGVRNKNCPTCNQIFKITQEEHKEKQRQKYIYTSLTTPNHKVDLAHILAETMTLIKYGLQAERFWLEASSTPTEVKSFFFNCIKMAHIWIGKNHWAANSLKGLLYITIINQEIKDSVPKIQVETSQEEMKKSGTSIDSTTKGPSILDDCKPAKNIFTFLNGE